MGRRSVRQCARACASTTPPQPSLSRPRSSSNATAARARLCEPRRSSAPSPWKMGSPGSAPSPSTWLHWTTSETLVHSSHSAAARTSPSSWGRWWHTAATTATRRGVWVSSRPGSPPSLRRRTRMSHTRSSGMGGQQPRPVGLALWMRACASQPLTADAGVTSRTTACSRAVARRASWPSRSCSPSRAQTASGVCATAALSSHTSPGKASTRPTRGWRSAIPTTRTKCAPASSSAPKRGSTRPLPRARLSLRPSSSARGLTTSVLHCKPRPSPQRERGGADSRRRRRECTWARVRRRAGALRHIAVQE
mmetsp:Transcript_21088/g.56802  ORF Transcript_21088/g.56802 Transcript_21088/m.56802 type:complete len:308 (+) Transcript_21088:232-1155(+)